MQIIKKNYTFTVRKLWVKMVNRTSFKSKQTKLYTLKMFVTIYLILFYISEVFKEIVLLKM